MNQITSRHVYSQCVWKPSPDHWWCCTRAPATRAVLQWNGREPVMCSCAKSLKGRSSKLQRSIANKHGLQDVREDNQEAIRKFLDWHKLYKWETTWMRKEEILLDESGRFLWESIILYKKKEWVGVLCILALPKSLSCSPFPPYRRLMMKPDNKTVVRGWLHKWIDSCLTRRKQGVHVRGIFQSRARLTSGVQCWDHHYFWSM